MNDTQLPPGSVARDAAIQARIDAAVAQLPADYAPRTRHVNGTELPHEGEHAHPLAPQGSRPNYANQLLLSASPYLRQHAHNPVDWRPWGQAALQEAKALNRPVFLSVGYATCHWCHVMEHESFEDLQIAERMNSRYVPVKVDREERPDVDSAYMAAVQAMTGQGGWPMSVWLWPVAADPDQREVQQGEDKGALEGLPYFAGTYFPPHDGHRGMRRGFFNILEQLADACARDLPRVLDGGEQVADAIRRHLLGTPPGTQLPELAAIDAVASEVAMSYDAIHGGRNWAPKFPSSMPIRLLLRHAQRSGETRSRDMALHTLRRMAMGGIRDHVGGGWHRYSTDGRWFAPHFEKMLYDQGLIGLALADAVQVAPEPLLTDALAETLDGMLRSLRNADGAFCAATDADSEGAEGRYFIWTIAELRETLGADDGDWLAQLIGATAAGTFEGSNIIHLQRLPTESEWPRLKSARERLRTRQVLREAPLRDDKVLTAWNGLGISALARGYAVLGEARWLEAATTAMQYLLANLVRDGRLLRSRLGTEAMIPAFLDDHAALVQALLDLFAATQDLTWLRHALHWQAEQDRLFLSPDGRGYLATAADVETVVARARPDHDGAEPCGNSLAAHNLVRLAGLTGHPHWRQAAEQQLQAFEPLLVSRPGSLAEFLLALDAHASQRQIVLIAPAGEGLAPLQPFLAAVRTRWLPDVAVIAVNEGDISGLLEILPILEGRIAMQNVATAYVCRDSACELPTTDLEAFVRQLNH
jgi:uncharacterized protein YyaL (SSP411 family)